MIKKNTYSILIVVVLLIIVYALFVNKKSENVISYNVNSKDEKCRDGYVRTTIVTLDGNIYTCDLASSFSEGPRLIGTGKETYTLRGYYHEYEQDFYPLDYDTDRGDTPLIRICKGFVVTSGNQEFIDTYRTKIKRIEEISGNIIINLNDMMVDNTLIKVLATTSPLSTMIKESSPTKQIDLDFNVRPFPERDINTCDSYGIYARSK